MSIIVGSPIIPWSSFIPCKDEKNVVWTENGMEEIIGQTTEEVTEMIWNGAPAYQRIQVTNSEKMGNRTGIVIVDKHTFAPLYYRSFYQDQEIVVEYRGVNVSGTIENEEGAFDFAYELPEPSFDSLSVEMVIRLLPMEIGYITTLTAFKSFSQQETTVSIEVVGEEKMHVGGGHEEQSWKVHVAFGTHLQTYWIGKETRQLLKQSNTFENGTKLEFVRK